MNQYALLVGVGQFEKNVGNLAFVENDVSEFYSVLVNNFGIPNDRISVLIDANATEARIFKTVDAICENAEKGDRVILYFSTHGKSVYDTTYLAAFDAFDDNSASTRGWISTPKLFTKFHNAECDILAFFDSCYSTQYIVTRGIDGEEKKPLSDTSINMVIFAATGKGGKAYQDIEHAHGCWTYMLLNALKGNVSKAFYGNTRQITMNSLQTYLAEEVRQRVYELYKEEQTPYIYGTYSKDLVLIEYPVSEESKMKIKDIYFGEIDADTELSSVPECEFISQNFYDLNSICTVFSTKNRVQFIIGNKGTGKTYLGEYLEKENDNILYRPLSAFSLSDIQKITVAQVEERGKFVDAWRYAIYTAIACSIINESKAGNEEFRALLCEIYGDEAELIIGSFEISKNLIFDKRIKNGVRLGEKYKVYRDKNGTVPICKLVMLYANLFNTYYKKEDKLFVLLDGLDEQIRGVISEKQKNFLLDLINMVDQSFNVLHGVRIILLFRDDILQVISGEANLNKSITARARVLSWLSNDEDLTKTPLYQLIQRRITTSESALGSTQGITVQDIIPSNMQYRNSWEWILDLTTYTPRDLISFFNCCKELSGEQIRLTPDNLWGATRKYSDYLWREFQDILGGTCLAGMDLELSAVFNDLAQRHNINTGTQFLYSELTNACSDMPKLKEIDGAEIHKVLYEAGILCIHTASKVYWHFRENPLPFDVNIWKEGKFEIHKGLWKKLHIW